jgi:hypothetical protein
MTGMRTAWRRAVDARAGDGSNGARPDLADLLALVGPDAGTSDWACEHVECEGPSADDLRRESAESIGGIRLTELAAGISRTHGGVFEATRPGEAGPWLALRAVDGTHFVVATRSRALLDDLRRRYRGGTG